MILVPFISLFLGVLGAFFLVGPIKGEAGQYLAVACLAGLDTILGGIRSLQEGKFSNDVFVTGFFSNVIIAFSLAWLGDKIFLNLFQVVALVLGARIFTNLSLIRRILLTKWHDARERKRLESLASQPQAETSRS
ncbi:MAG: small basic family protein [Armatimonadetes bacterium]|nr:small basic family protein [Armatimonadota bacterium]